jgi:hypothetical protein
MRNRFIVNPSREADRSINGRLHTWDVVDKQRDVAVGNYDTRNQARAEARAMNTAAQAEVAQ